MCSTISYVYVVKIMCINCCVILRTFAIFILYVFHLLLHCFVWFMKRLYLKVWHTVLSPLIEYISARVQDVQ